MHIQHQEEYKRSSKKGSNVDQKNQPINKVDEFAHTMAEQIIKFMSSSQVSGFIEQLQKPTPKSSYSLNNEEERIRDFNPFLNPWIISGTFLQAYGSMLTTPEKIQENITSFWEQYADMMTHLFDQKEDKAPFITPHHKDRRFKDESWDQNPYFNFIKQSYLLMCQSIKSSFSELNNLDPVTTRKIDFYLQQMLDALSPSNFLMTNPVVLRETIETNGQNLIKGLKNLLKDTQEGEFNIQMTDMDAFKLGENIAATPGKVVYQNELMQLIQYTPSTEKVFQIPLLIIPPWINKYYIFDLSEQNSMVKWMVGQGFTVFIVSWVNPTKELSHTRFDDYMKKGPLEALDFIRSALKVPYINALGYCLGGTLMTGTLSYMKKKKMDGFRSLSLMVTLTDFADPGDLKIFTDHAHLNALSKRMRKTGFLEGKTLATTYNLLRPNDLIWSNVINNYLLGKNPISMDFMYWNCDYTHLPMVAHMFFLRNMYYHNALIKPNGITLGDVPIDLRDINLPVHMISAIEDHIAPWKSTYAATQIFSGPVEFTLSGSGHVAGMINPPSKNKYGYKTNSKIFKTAQEWLSHAKDHEGSWWPHWAKWLKQFSGDRIKASSLEKLKIPFLEKAPGSYVKFK